MFLFLFFKNIWEYLNFEANVQGEYLFGSINVGLFFNRTDLITFYILPIKIELKIEWIEFNRIKIIYWLFRLFRLTMASAYNTLAKS